MGRENVKKRYRIQEKRKTVSSFQTGLIYHLVSDKKKRCFPWLSQLQIRQRLQGHSRLSVILVRIEELTMENVRDAYKITNINYDDLKNFDTHILNILKMWTTLAAWLCPISNFKISPSWDLVFCMDQGFKVRGQGHIEATSAWLVTST